MEIHYLAGSDAPAQAFLREFGRTATRLPFAGNIGSLVGHGTQTVVASLVGPSGARSIEASDGWVVKFEIYPGTISLSRLVSENSNEMLARRYLDRFMPPTLRIVGHGLGNRPSALVLQQRVRGLQLRRIPWDRIRQNRRLCSELVDFCDGVIAMARDTQQIPDLAGTLPRVDHLSNLFWRSRNIVIDLPVARVWLVDTGWKDGEECLDRGRLRSRIRARVRLISLCLFRRRLAQVLRGKGEGRCCR